ncbi:hypothetical protein D3C81_1909650 [compost metagenome]
MRHVNYNGVQHFYAEDREDLDPFVKELCKALNLQFPNEIIQDEHLIRKAIVETVSNIQKYKVEQSWIENPECMGR